MRMKSLIVIMICSIVCSCSLVSKDENAHQKTNIGRSLSSLKIQQVDNVASFVSKLKASVHERFISVIDVYEWHGGEFVGLGYREIHWGQGEGPLSFKLDSQDRILEVKPIENFLLVRSFFGLLLKVNKFGIEVVQAGFPVASFEYVDGVLHLYNKNGSGRFCDQEELQRPPKQRDPSCQLIADKLVLD